MNWAINTPNPDAGIPPLEQTFTLDDIPDNVLFTFFTFMSNTARPFQSVEMLKAAMTSLMEARADFGLDFVSVAGFPPQPSLVSCSEATYEAGTLIQNGFFTG